MYREVKEEIKALKEIFGDIDYLPIWSDYDSLKEGEEITIINENCEFEYDSYYSQFGENLSYCYIVAVEINETDLSEYNPDKSNNGGAYAYAKCTIKKIHKKTY